ncbi:hypothetical protein [Streptomyces sp. M2CJ-2]|uniref:hypothetical protein n=1 Tax=Streptomyces sp. M2CJ-2 TaxID=2803948 RepID=UPI001F3387D1|nr:hypothetical protein [Streptomyces sp. M2CJ-2]
MVLEPGLAPCVPDRVVEPGRALEGGACGDGVVDPRGHLALGGEGSGLGAPGAELQPEAVSGDRGEGLLPYGATGARHLDVHGVGEAERGRLVDLSGHGQRGIRLDLQGGEHEAVGHGDGVERGRDGCLPGHDAHPQTRWEQLRRGEPGQVVEVGHGVRQRRQAGREDRGVVHEMSEDERY